MNIKPVLRRVARLGVAIASITTFVLAGCGGGGGTSSGGGTPANITGRFVDATVVGIAYKCGTSTAVAGLTNANGEYTCPSGQAVAFYVGDILIGQVSSPLAVITPLDMVGAGATPSNTTVANIVRFLMSISSTDPATGTITIDPAVASAAVGQTADFTAASATVLDTLIPTLKPGATIYTSAQATAHVSASIFGLFAGNYAGTYSGSFGGSWSVTIAADGTVSGQVDGAPVSGAMTTTLSTGSTYGFSGTGGGVPWAGTLNVSSKVFSGTWDNGAGSSGTWTGTVDSTTPVATPTVTGFSPTTGAVGTTVTITGTNLGSFTPAPVVKFGSIVATVSSATATAITVTVPHGVVIGNTAITLSNFDGTGVVAVGTFNVTAATAVPAAPTGVSATTVSSSQINLSWSAVSGAQAYYVYRATTAGLPVASMTNVTSGSAMVGPSTVATSLNDSYTLSAGTAYYYKVVALNAIGASVASAEVSATTSIVPVGVTVPAAAYTPQQTMNFLLATPAAGKIGLYIPATDPALNGNEGLNVYRSTSPNVAITSANLVTPLPITKNPNSGGYGTWWFSFWDAGLIPATKYYYKVALVNAAGEGPASPELMARTPLATVGAGAGLAFSPAFKGITAFQNAIPAEWGPTTQFVSSFSNGLARVFQFAYTVDAVNGDLLSLGVADTTGGTESAALDVASLMPNCAITSAVGYTACSALGITIDRAAGSITFASTPMKVTYGASAGSLFNMSGTMNFSPF